MYVYTTYGYEASAETTETLKLPFNKLKGEDRADGIVLTDGTEIPVDGVFILRSAIAPSTILSGIDMDGPHIRVGRDQETNYEGCYAAGDCTGRPYQITKAVGEGNIAAHSMLERLGK